MELRDIKKHLEAIVFKEKDPFVSHREINWQRLAKIGGSSVAIAVVILLLMPTPEQADHKFTDKDGETIVPPAAANQIGDELSVRQNSLNGAYKAQGSFDYLSARSGPSRLSSREIDRTSAMIISRAGMDSRNQLPPGTRMPVRLTQGVLVSSQPMPIIAKVTADVSQEDSVAIPTESKIFGEMSFDDGSSRANVTWKSIEFPDGRERQINGIGLGLDGQLGVAGVIHSDGLKNTAGQFLSRFVGAYAEGSMQKGMLGSSDGGHGNGLKNAVAETAKDQSSEFAEDLKKQRRWIELNAGAEFQAILSQNFTFRDPGATNGQ
jgi:type IV secretory pathway VirB10-like protein